MSRTWHGHRGRLRPSTLIGMPLLCCGGDHPSPGACLDEPPEPDSAHVLEQIKGPPRTLEGAAAHNVDGSRGQQATSSPDRRCHFAAHNVDGSFVGDRGVLLRARNENGLSTRTAQPPLSHLYSSVRRGQNFRSGSGWTLMPPWKPSSPSTPPRSGGPSAVSTAFCSAATCR
jgi:hypothetical protein